MESQSLQTTQASVISPISSALSPISQFPFLVFVPKSCSQTAISTSIRSQQGCLHLWRLAEFQGVKNPRRTLFYKGSAFSKGYVCISSCYWLHPSLMKWMKQVVVVFLPQMRCLVSKAKLRTSSKPTSRKLPRPGWIRTELRATKDSH